MKWSPYSETNTNLVNQEILRILRSLKVHYRAHNSLPVDPLPSQMNPVHVLKPYFFKVHFHIIFLPTPRSPKWPKHFRTKMLYSYIIDSLHATYPTHHIFYLISLIVMLFNILVYLWCLLAHLTETPRWRTICHIFNECVKKI
jgi:hypothetical protein